MLSSVNIYTVWLIVMNGRHRNATNVQIRGKQNDLNYEGNCTARHCLSRRYAISGRWIFVWGSVHIYYLLFDSNNSPYIVHTTCLPVSQDSSQHIKCWKPYAVIYGLALLKVGIIVPETWWANGLLINHNCCIKLVSQIISYEGCTVTRT